MWECKRGANARHRRRPPLCDRLGGYDTHGVLHDGPLGNNTRRQSSLAMTMLVPPLAALLLAAAPARAAGLTDDSLFQFRDLVAIDGSHVDLSELKGNVRIILSTHTSPTPQRI